MGLLGSAEGQQQSIQDGCTLAASEAQRGLSLGSDLPFVQIPAPSHSPGLCAPQIVCMYVWSVFCVEILSTRERIYSW